ncbi:hypothetical protein Vadar_024332 [Vaccinium darrowii]|uniref:Uncharacterized protein n=1 Tax=Vaccinium darrowii TaxID=229202 RepID=A0ACB7Z5R1_9ERIC|nr:hypothetical protein Vadar_024332 [Vaccinium darrowii]
MAVLEDNSAEGERTPPRTATKVVDTGKTHAATTSQPPRFEDDDTDRNERFADTHAWAYIRNLEDRMARRDKTLDALREDVQLIATAIRSGQFKQPRTPSPPLVDDGERRRSIKDRLSLQIQAGNEERPTSQYHDVAVQQFKLGLDSASSAFADLKLNEPANMDELMLRINQHNKLDEAISERERAEQKHFRSGKRGHGRKDVNNIQFSKNEKEKDPRRSSYQGPRPQEFEGVVTVFKEPLHELLKKIKREDWFSLAPKNGPKPPVCDLKYRCRYHNVKGHLTTWCPQFKAYLEEKVSEGNLGEYIDHEKTRAKAKGGKKADNDDDEDLLDVQVIHGYADAEAEQQLREELKAVNSAKEVMADFSKLKMEQVGQSCNVYADTLAGLAAACEYGNGRTITIRSIERPTIEEAPVVAVMTSIVLPFVYFYSLKDPPGKGGGS